MYFCVYRSTAQVEPLSVNEGAIYLAARDRNPALGITGYLHREDGCFVQYLEGPRDAVERLVWAIRLDARHSGLLVLTDGVTKDRRFGGWDMAFTHEERASFRTFQKARGRSGSIRRATATDILRFMEATASFGCCGADAALATTGWRAMVRCGPSPIATRPRR